MLSRANQTGANARNRFLPKTTQILKTLKNISIFCLHVVIKKNLLIWFHNLIFLEIILLDNQKGSS